MRHYTSSLCTLAIVLSTSALCGAQEQALQRVVTESARLRQAPEPNESDVWKDIKAHRERTSGLHSALRDWIESVLPQSRAELDAAISSLPLRLNADLWRVGLLEPEALDRSFRPGVVSRVELVRPPEDPGKLAVIVGATIPCGSADTVYVYDYTAGPPRRVLESHGSRDHDETISGIHFSAHGAEGEQLILTLRYAVQCGSSWNELSYDLFRLPANWDRAAPILGGQHGIWFGAYDPYQVRLAPDDLLMEIRDRSIDADLHNRAHVLHYRAGATGAERTDPVALQPQDFVDEWLNRPWTEMESRSAEAARDKLQKWHELLAGDFVAGDFTIVQACREKPGQWQVGIDLDWIKGKELPEPLSVFFLVQQKDQNRFQATGISFDRQEGCPGEGQPSQENPSLFPKQK